jgi:hypothetical protein
MTLDELFQLRDEFRKLQGDLKEEREQEKRLVAKIDQKSKALEDVQRSAEDVQKKLDILKDNQAQIPVLLAEADTAEKEIAELEDGLAEINALIGVIRDVLRNESGQSPKDLQAQLSLRSKQLSTSMRRKLSRLVRKFGGTFNKKTVEALLNYLETQSEEIKKKIKSAKWRRTRARHLADQYSHEASQISEFEEEEEDLQKRIAILAATLHQLRTLLDSVRSRMAQLENEINQKDALYQSYLENLIPGLDFRIPIAFLPVRLETRYWPPSNPSELRIRIYPDDIHQDAHEPTLSATEFGWGDHFWRQIWCAGQSYKYEPEDDAEKRKVREQEAWAQLSRMYGTRRAAWIVREMKPINSNDRPVSPAPDEQFLKEYPKYSQNIQPVDDGIKEREKERVNTSVLPDRWVALGYRNRKRIKEVWGDLIPQPLYTGYYQVDGDELTRWMIDFDQAYKEGMGLIMPFEAEESKELDFLLVFGVKGTLTPDDSAREVEALLDAHHYTWGLDIIPQGTPTNNTDEVRSGFSSQQDYKESLQAEFIRTGINSDSDAFVLASYLGITTDPLRHLLHAGCTDQKDARHMQLVLWPSTWEYFLRHMMTGEILKEDKEFPGGMDFDIWRRHFIDFVRARGPLPALRVFNQPYGFLPVTSLEHWVPKEYEPDLLIFSVNNRTANLGSLRIAWDFMSQAMRSQELKEFFETRSLNDANCAVGVTVVELAGKNRPDIVYLRIDKNAVDGKEYGYLIVAHEVSDKGLARSWTVSKPIANSIRGQTEAAALTAANIGTYGHPAAIVLRIGRKSPNAPSAFAHLHIGWDLNDEGETEHWSSDIPVLKNISGKVLGAGIAVVDSGTENLPDIVVLYAVKESGENRIFITIGQRIDNKGNFDGGWTGPTRLLELEKCLNDYDMEKFSATLDRQEDGYYRLIVSCLKKEVSRYAVTLFKGESMDLEVAKLTWQELGCLYLSESSIQSFAIASADLGRSRKVSLFSGGTGLVNLLCGLREIWRQTIEDEKIPFVGRGKDPDIELLQMLSLQPLSNHFHARSLLGGELYKAIQDLSGSADKASSNNQYLTETLKLFEALGYPWKPWLMNGVFYTKAHVLSYPLVQDETLSETRPLIDNYISWLATSKHLDEIYNDQYFNGKKKPLLYRLLRHALLMAYAESALNVEPNTALENNPEPELLEKDTVTYWSHLSKVYQQKRTNLNNELMKGFLSSMTALKDIPTAALARLLIENLDLSAHRLDAWITSVATRRLKEMRDDKTAKGIFMGGFGWVANLKPKEDNESQSTGYIHAPSIAQAATAAILRSGYLSHKKGNNGDLLAVDLSSQRVRLAMELIDGVHQGQPLSALLGYRFERALHEHYPGLELDKYITVFRELCPLTARKLNQSPEAVENIAANNVVDGLALIRNWQDKKLPFGEKVLDIPLPNDGEVYDAILKELGALRDATDAIGDLSVAESVYQAVQGNYVRAAAGLDAFCRGEALPSRPEVVRTPRTGVALTHRIMVVLSTLHSVDASGWTQKPRATAEPNLNAWVAQLLGDPARVLCRIKYAATETGKDFPETSFRIISLADLQLCPLDILYASMLNDEAQLSDMEQRIIYHAQRTRPNGIPEDAKVNLYFARDNVWLPKQLSFPELFEVARQARELTSHSRPIDGRDIAQPGKGAPNVILDEIVARARTSESALDDCRKHLEGILLTFLVSTDAASDIALSDHLREALMSAADFGIQGAIPVSANGISDKSWEALFNQAIAVEQEIVNRLHGLGQPLLSADEIINLEGLMSKIDEDNMDALSQYFREQFKPETLELLNLKEEEVSLSEKAKRLLKTKKSMALVLELNAIVDNPDFYDPSRFSKPLSADIAMKKCTENCDEIAEKTRCLNRLLLQDYFEKELIKWAPSAKTDAITTLKVIFGADFNILPQFSAVSNARGDTESDIELALGRRKNAKDAGNEYIIPWFQNICAVRDGAARLNNALLYSEAITDKIMSEFQVAQLPVEENDKWAVLPLRSGEKLRGGRLSLVILSPFNPELRQPLCGLMVDEWVETVPNEMETTGVTFHYDAPGACAPQTVLIAVPPDPRRRWDVNVLESVLLETFELAKLRAVDIQSLGQVGHYLPALYFAYNREDRTIASDFWR